MTSKPHPNIFVTAKSLAGNNCFIDWNKKYGH